MGRLDELQQPAAPPRATRRRCLVHGVLALCVFGAWNLYERLSVPRFELTSHGSVEMKIQADEFDWFEVTLSLARPCPKFTDRHADSSLRARRLNGCGVTKSRSNALVLKYVADRTSADIDRRPPGAARLRQAARAEGRRCAHQVPSQVSGWTQEVARARLVQSGMRFLLQLHYGRVTMHLRAGRVALVSRSMCIRRS